MVRITHLRSKYGGSGGRSLPEEKNCEPQTKIFEIFSPDPFFEGGGILRHFFETLFLKGGGILSDTE